VGFFAFRRGELQRRNYTGGLGGWKKVRSPDLMPRGREWIGEYGTPKSIEVN
jgi:hypothetical protein